MNTLDRLDAANDLWSEAIELNYRLFQVCNYNDILEKRTQRALKVIQRNNKRVSRRGKLSSELLEQL